MKSYAALLVSLATLSGCGRIGFGITDQTDATSSGDGSSGDAGPTVYGDFTDLGNWQAFDITTVMAGAAGFTGAVFDGRYTYFVPSYNGTNDGLVARFDNEASFTDATSWTVFDTATVNSMAGGFDGGTFDGRYVYFSPHQNNAAFDGVVARYDIQQPFTAPAAWSTFDTGPLATYAVGYYGARFDGRYVYFVPYYSSILARYDTQGAFGSAASWTTFDLTTVSAGVPAYVGAVFDGRFLYFAPFITASASGLVARYDTQGVLTDTTAWSTFDVSTVSATAVGFCGAAFDGRHIYLMPFLGTTAPVSRYDTQAPFTATSSWEIFDAVTVNPGATGYMGATFDGRFLYLSPYPGSLAARYDTQATFTDPTAWRTLDTTTVSPQASQFYGATFDGAAVYFVPHGASTAIRFAAKAPPSMPVLPAYLGSFL